MYCYMLDFWIKHCTQPEHRETSGGYRLPVLGWCINFKRHYTRVITVLRDFESFKETGKDRECHSKGHLEILPFRLISIKTFCKCSVLASHRSNILTLLTKYWGCISVGTERGISVFHYDTYDHSISPSNIPISGRTKAVRILNLFVSRRWWSSL